MTEKTLGKTPGKTTDRVLTLLRDNPRLSIPDIAAIVGRSVSSIEGTVRGLKSDGELARVGPHKGGQWVVLDSD